MLNYIDFGGIENLKEMEKEVAHIIAKKLNLRQNQVLATLNLLNDITNIELIDLRLSISFSNFLISLE